jgi:hypothetical protein
MIPVVYLRPRSDGERSGWGKYERPGECLLPVFAALNVRDPDLADP